MADLVVVPSNPTRVATVSLAMVEMDAIFAVELMDVPCVMVDQMDAPNPMGEWIEVMVADLIVVIVGNVRSLYIKSVAVMRYLRVLS
jgi:hypothetical protein